MKSYKYSGEGRLGNFRELLVWQKAHTLTLDLYKVSADFPRQETFGITSQMRRAAISIELNLAEGCGRRTDGDFGRFIAMSRGSLREVENLLLLARDLGYLASDREIELQKQATKIGKMLSGLTAGIRR